MDAGSATWQVSRKSNSQDPVSAEVRQLAPSALAPAAQASDDHS